MFKPSGVLITKEELDQLIRSEYPLTYIGKLLDKYHFPADAAISKETGEIFFDCE